MTAKHEHPKIYCPFCSWHKRVFNLPAHLISRHPTEIRLRPISSDHCVYGYVIDKEEKVNFSVCLSCEKGTVGDGVSGNSARWVSMHSSNEDCKENHSKLLAELKCTINNDSMPCSSETQPISIANTELITPVTPPIEPINAAVASINGYLYCFANISMPGIVKIGMTRRTPLERLEEANSSNTWKPPTPYTVALAKRVTEPTIKESTIHKLLEKYSEKIHARREFFRISVDDVRLFFDLMDGEYCDY